MAHVPHREFGERYIAMIQRRYHRNGTKQCLFFDQVRDQRGRGYAFDAHLTEDAQVLRVVHAGNHTRHIEHALSHFAGYQIRIILPRSTYEDIGLPDTCIFLTTRIAGITLDDQIGAF